MLTGFPLILQGGDALDLSSSNSGKFLAVGCPLTNTGKKMFCNALVHLFKMLRADLYRGVDKQAGQASGMHLSKVQRRGGSEIGTRALSQRVLRLSVKSVHVVSISYLSAILIRSTSFEG